MKFFATTLFAAGAIAGLVERQDVGAVSSALQAITSATSNLQSAVQAFNGGDQQPVLSAAAAVTSAINSATSSVNAIPQPLTLAEALRLQDPTTALGSAVRSAVDGAIAKKDTFVSSNTAGLVLENLQSFKSASDTLISAIRGKVPSAAGEIVTGLVEPIVRALDEGIAAFTGLGGAPTSSGAAPTAAPTGASSSGAAPTSVRPTATGPAPTGTRPTPTSTPPPFPGAANGLTAGFGGAAVVALLVAAL